jgi:hypothetical protein
MKAPRKAKKPKRQPDASYEAYGAEWERRRKAPDRGGGEWLVDRPKLPVDPVPFLQTLRQLGYVTQDRRFMELHRYLMTGSDLIDPATEKWSLHGTKLARFLPELIENAIAGDFPERQAIAEAVAKFGLYLDAQSFDAAWKRLERLLHEWRKSVGQKPA